MNRVLHGLMSESARRDPGHEAVRCAGRSMTYGELDAASNGVARALIGAGVERGDRVAILLPKGLELVVAVYGVMKAGACYVPLDPLAPVIRGAVVAVDCAARVVVTVPSRAGALAAAVEEKGHRPAAIVLVDDGTPAADLPCPTLRFEDVIAGPSPSAPDVPVIEEDLAYILYTSGSTGVPKGVMLTHRNALAFVEWSRSKIGVGPEDRLSNHAPLHFDLSVFDLFVAALAGATVVMVPSDEGYFGSALVDLVRQERITVWYSVPSALMLLTKALPEPGLLPSLRSVVFAGEVYPTRHLRALRRLIPNADLWNLYGPTETNVVTYYRLAELPPDDRTIPIGRACEGTEVFAIRGDGGVAAVGEEGELYVRGPTVMKGYWRRPEKTAEMLGPDPRDRYPKDVVYRTGDLVRLRPDGDYDFVGRRDHQIKSRGYRIELGEIETVLNAHPSVAEGVALAVPHDDWGSAIHAFVVPVDGAELTEQALRRHVGQRLPRYMVPFRVEVIDSLPRTSTGKVDRQRLRGEAGARR